MFMKYNAVLRGLQLAFARPDFEGLCRGNHYTTTLHAINSVIVKLSKLTIATKVYRGVSGGRLPASFRTPNKFNVRGGIDSAFMSTTINREVAKTYAASRGGPGIVFSIQQGMVDRGAEIGWLSQYPHEKEVRAPRHSAADPSPIAHSPNSNPNSSPEPNPIPIQNTIPIPIPNPNPNPNPNPSCPFGTSLPHCVSRRGTVRDPNPRHRHPFCRRCCLLRSPVSRYSS